MTTGDALLPSGTIDRQRPGLGVERAASAGGARQQRSLQEGFAEYVTPTEADYSAVLRHGLVIVDTNVVLNLYRYNPTAREDLFRILEALGDRLFVPHQVVAEFWANREAVIRASVDESTRLTEELETQHARSAQSLVAWAGRLALADDIREQLSGTLSSAYGRLAAIVDEVASQGLTHDALDTNLDRVLLRLGPLLTGRVGAPLSAPELEAALRESERRIDAQEPPGFADAKKRGGARHGDYVMWKQVLVEAEARDLDVLLVTADVKDDWWRRDGGSTRGPRLELSREFAAVSGRRLYMLRPARLFMLAGSALGLSIGDASMRTAESIDQLATGRRRNLIEKLPDGRGGTYLDTVIEMVALADESPTLDQYITSFQERFPSITLREVARRRMRSLESLGLVEVVGARVVITGLGQQLLDQRVLSLLQDAFLSNIAGASEIRELASLSSLPDLRSDLRHSPPPGLSATQSSLVLRWLEQLELVGEGNP